MYSNINPRDISDVSRLVNKVGLLVPGNVELEAIVVVLGHPRVVNPVGGIAIDFQSCDCLSGGCAFVTESSAKGLSVE